MKANEIFKNTVSVDKEQAIELIIDHLTWGDSILYVSGGNGGNGAGQLAGLSDTEMENLKSELYSCSFDNNPSEIADDFSKSDLDASDYRYCVQFTDANDGWMQFLLWD